MENYDTDVYVYSLRILYEKGFIDNIKNFYLKNKPELIKDYPFIDKYDDEIMSVYASYYIHAFANRTEQYNSIVRFIDFDNIREDDIIKIQDYYRESLTEWIRCLYEIDINTDEMERARFKSYKTSLLVRFSETDYTRSFMSVCYNPIFEVTIKKFLYENYIKLERLDMNTDDDNYLKNAVKCLYIMLSMDYQEDFKKSKRKLGKDFKRIEYDEAMDITTDYFSALNSVLYTEEEFMEERAARIRNGNEVKRISDEQIMILKQNPEFVRRLTPQKNNE